MILAFALLLAAALEPGREMEALKPLEGVWSCKIPEGRVKLSVKRDLGSLWQSVTFEQPGRKHQKPHVLKGYWGWDDGAKKFVRALFGSFGDFETASSAGWEGDKLIWLGEMHNFSGGQTAPVRHTFARAGDKVLKVTLEMQKDGAWSAASTCDFKR